MSAKENVGPAQLNLTQLYPLTNEGKLVFGASYWLHAKISLSLFKIIITNQKWLDY